jgi:virginiamycin A acetyltransferase
MAKRVILIVTGIILIVLGAVGAAGGGHLTARSRSSRQSAPDLTRFSDPTTDSRHGYDTMTAPDSNQLHPVTGQHRVVFLKPLVKRPTIEVGEYTYYDHPDDPTRFEQDAVLYGFGPEKLIIGKFCAIAAGVRFLLPGANHADLGPSTYPFGVFGGGWADTMDLVMSAPSRGNTVVGNDVWFGYQAMIMPAVTIGHGAVIAAGSVVANDVPPFGVVGGNPARLIRRRFDETGVRQLLKAAWWDWPVDAITRYARAIMSGTPAELLAIAEEHGWTAEEQPAAGD